MTSVFQAAVLVRRILARHPAIQWGAIALLAVALAATLHDHTRSVDDARAAWGRTVSVWVVASPHEAGDPLIAERTDVPEAFAPESAVTDPSGATARHALTAGDIVTVADVASGSGPLALAPDGWLVAPMIESPPSGAAVGDQVQVVSEGVVLAARAIVVDRFADTVLVAVPREVAPLLPAASGVASVSLLRVP